MTVTNEGACKFVSSVGRETKATVKLYAGDQIYPDDIVEITYGDEAMGFDPISFKTVEDFRTFLGMLNRFDERL